MGTVSSPLDIHTEVHALPPSLVARAPLPPVVGLAATARGLACLSFAPTVEDAAGRLAQWQQRRHGGVSKVATPSAKARQHLAQGWEAVISWLTADAVHAPDALAAVPLDIHGTPFFLQVWEQLRRVGPGETLSYTALAARAGNPRAIRAAAAACARNTLPLFIPCHRVLARDGMLGGFAWGLPAKRWLLAREGAGQALTSGGR